MEFTNSVLDVDHGQADQKRNPLSKWQNIENTVYFAGEAFAPFGSTATTHGALLSAKNISRMIF